MVVVSTKTDSQTIGVFDGVSEIHRPCSFRRLDSQGNTNLDPIPGFFWYTPLGDYDSTIGLLRAKIGEHPSARKYDIGYLFEGNCPLDESVRRTIDHSSELPVIQVVKRMKNEHITEFFPSDPPKSYLELLSYGIVHNHW